MVVEELAHVEGRDFAHALQDFGRPDFIVGGGRRFCCCCGGEEEREDERDR